MSADPTPTTSPDLSTTGEPLARLLRWLRGLVTGPTAELRSQRRITVAALTLVLLLVEARAGTPTSVLVALAALFLAAAAVWLHGQYVDDLDGEQWTLPLRKAWAFTIGGSVLGIVGLAAELPGVFPAGLILTWFGVAFVMTSKRQQPIDPRRQLVKLLVGAGLTVLGTALLPTATLLAGILVVGGLAVLVPPALALLAESAIRTMTDSDSGWQQPVPVMLAGALGLVLTCAAGWLVGSGTVVVLCLAVAALVVAMVSGTHADFVALMLVTALFGVTPHSERPPSTVHTTTSAADAKPLPTSKVLVSLGDSYMSGEGASVFYDDTDHGSDGNQCRQSPTSWAAQAGQMPPFKGLLFLACQGAVVPNILREDVPVGPDVPKPKVQAGTTATQLDAAVAALAKDHVQPALVVLSVGGNDAGFSGIGQMCLGPGECDSKHEIWDAESNFAQLRAQLDAVYSQVSDVFPTTPVAVIPYPDPIYGGPDGKHVSCGQLLLSRDEALFVKRFLTGTPDGTPASEAVVGLNRVIAQAAAAHGFYYVAPMQEALREAHLQLCDSENRGHPGLHFIGLRSVQGATEQRFNPKNWIHSSLHPNERGHAALLRAFEQWYGGMLAPRPDETGQTQASPTLTQLPARTTPDEVVPAPAVPAEGCRIADRKEGCRGDAAQWSLEQIRSALLTYGWTLGVVALFAVMLASGFTAWRRRQYLQTRPVPFP